MKRVTGIGGIFFTAKDPIALRAWYQRHLGIDVQEWGGAAFVWADGEGKPTTGTTIWSVAQEKSVPVLKRHAFMKHLVDSRQFTPAQLLAPDLFHLNDLSYRCLGNLVADAIGDGLDKAVKGTQRSRTAAAR